MQFNETVKKSREGRTQMEVEKATLERNIKGAEEEGRKVEREVQEIKKTISDSRLQTSNKMSAFGSDVHRVLADIERYEKERRWRGDKPIGPFGFSLYNDRDVCKVREEVSSIPKSARVASEQNFKCIRRYHS